VPVEAAAGDAERCRERFDPDVIRAAGWPGSRRCVLGWRIRRAAPDFVLLSAGSRLGMPGELLFKRERSGLLFATFVQQRTSLARAIWGRAEPVHQRVVSSLLTQAARREAASWPVVR